VLTVNLPACSNSTLYVCELFVVEAINVNEFVAITPKGKSITGIGVGVGGGVGVLKLTLSPLSLLIGVGVEVGAVDCCVGLSVAVGGAVAGADVFICELLFLLKTSGSEAYPVKKINAVIRTLIIVAMAAILVHFPCGHTFLPKQVYC